MQTDTIASNTSAPAPLAWLSLGGRLFLGGFFLIAGAEKLTVLDQFAHAIANYQLLPLGLVNIAALVFVWMELTAGILLVAGAAVRGSALLSGLLLVVFLAAILSAMARGLTIDCGCFAPVRDAAGSIITGGNSALDTVGWPKVLEDLGLLVLSVWLIYLPRSPWSIDALVRHDRTAHAAAAPSDGTQSI